MKIISNWIFEWDFGMIMYLMGYTLWHPWLLTLLCKMVRENRSFVLIYPLKGRIFHNDVELQQGNTSPDSLARSRMISLTWPHR